jgi:Family of unknown function (DUF5954)
VTESGDAFQELRRIKIAPADDPLSLVSEDDARRAWVEYPRICYVGPMFGAAEHVEGLRWKVLHHQNQMPQQCRDDLSSYFRRLAKVTEDPALRAECEAAYTKLEWEKVDELAAGGKRVRVIRIERFIRVRQVEQVAEPPRPTDHDPFDPERAEQDITKGFVMDPNEPSGWGDAAIRERVLPSAYPASLVSPEMYADSLRAIDDYPGGVLLPVEFAVGEREDGQRNWKPLGDTGPSVQGARRQLASSLRFRANQGRELGLSRADWLELGLPELDEATQRRYHEVADQIERERNLNQVRVPGRTFQIIRVMRLVRYSPDGPEPPRPSDPDPELPVEVLVQQEGIVIED